MRQTCRERENAIAFQSVPDTVEIILHFEYEGRGSIITLYGKYSGAYDQAALDDLADAVNDAVILDVQPLMTAAQSYTGVDVRGLNDENDFASGIVTGGLAGTVSAAALPPNVSLAIKRVSAFTGRSARGRIFVPFLNQNFMQTDRNFVTQAAADAWVDLLDALDTVLLGEGWTPVIVSRYSGGALRTFGITFPIISWQYGDLNVDSQRRRLKPD